MGRETGGTEAVGAVMGTPEPLAPSVVPHFQQEVTVSKLLAPHLGQLMRPARCAMFLLSFLEWVRQRQTPYISVAPGAENRGQYGPSECLLLPSAEQCPDLCRYAPPRLSLRECLHGLGCHEYDRGHPSLSD